MNSYETVKKVLENIAGPGVTFSLDQPEDFAHGDYATNIAFSLSKKIRSGESERIHSPSEIATEIIPQLLKSLDTVVEKIEVAGPGFINFFLKDSEIQKENNGRDIVTNFRGKNVLVEHSSPNLFKPFTIGHFVNNCIGEFVARALKVGGAHVTTLSFPSDISIGIAKAILIIKEDKKNGRDILGTTADENTIVTYLGECYVRGVALAKENPELESHIKDIAKTLYDQIDGGIKENSEEYKIWSHSRTISNLYVSNFLESIGTKIDSIIYESDVAFSGKEIVKSNPNIFTEGERGAIIYIPKDDTPWLHTSVFINGEGHATYEAKDLALIQKKFTEYRGARGSIDFSYFVTDIEQMHHFRVVLDAAFKLGGDWVDWVENSRHITHGRMLLKGEKMSSRLGGVPLALDVITTVEEEVRERAGEKIAHLNEEERKSLEKEIALSALRISVLRSKPGININFDPETSLSFEGDSGPYLLYSHARCASLLDKGNVTPTWGKYPATQIEKKLIHFERTLEETINELAPQKLVTYLFSTAQLFNAYYAQQQIIIVGDESGNAHRLMIVKRTKEVLSRGLHVLGIIAPTRM